MKNRKLYNVIVPLLSILLSFIVGAIIIAALGANPFEAFGYLFKGSFGTINAFGNTLNRATPLIFTGLCACFAYKCGVFNLGGEGQFLMGAITACVVALVLGDKGIEGPLVCILCLILGTVVGGLWAFIPAILKIKRGQNEMIISIMLNYIATLLMGVIYTNWMRDASIPQTLPVPDATKLSRVFPRLRFTWGFVIAVIVGILMWVYLFKTSGGFKIRAVGYNGTAARFNGYPVMRLMILSFIVSGAVAGLGGASELLGTQFRLINGFGAGYGFDGVSMALIGQLNPLATIIVAIFFAALRVGSTAMQAASGVPTSVSGIIQALVIIFTVAGMALVELPSFQARFDRKKEA